ncbi:MAG: tetratricopeptide repeat protein [Planctomycetes bacterium]|nr:tetratricopeptide repeat protein [Planctomycetota bacterium]
MPDHPVPDPAPDSGAGGQRTEMGGKGATDRSRVLRLLQQKAQSSFDLHLRDHHEDSDVPVRVDDETKALRDPSGRYEVLGEIGRGGVGVVYKGRDRDLGREVAMKVLRSEYAERPEILERFVEEAQIGGQLQHPGIVPVYELGLQHGERPYIAMKLVKGSTLADLLAQRSSISQDRRRLLGIFEQICQTLAYAHARRVVHRDLKPQNVMLGSFGEVQVVDWGLAKVLPSDGRRERDDPSSKPSGASVISTLRSDPDKGMHSQVGSTFGTPAYMPPEQALGDVERMDQRSDVFGLGAILCEILSGEPPYREQDGEQLLQAARADLQGAYRRIAGSGADAAVIALCKQCLSPAREARPASAREVAEAIGQYLSSVEERAREAQIHAAEARVRARSTVLLSIAALLLLTLGGGGYLYIQGEAQARRDEADRLVVAALNDANVRYGEARTAARTDVAIWERALDAATQAERLAAAPDVGADARTRARELLAAVQRDQAGARAEAARDAKDAAMRQRLLEVRIPVDENTALPDFLRKNAARIDTAYRAAFRDYFDGADVTAMSVAEFRAAADADIAVELAAALDHWVSARVFLAQETGADPASAELTNRLQGLAMAVDPDVWRNRLRTLMSEGQPDREKLIALQEGAALESLPLLSLSILGQALWNVGAMDQARSVYLAACDRFPTDFSSAFQLGILHEAEKDNAAAAGYFRIARALRPDMREVRHRYGLALGSVGDLVGSERVFRELVLQDPENGHWHFHLGLLCSFQPRHAEAVESFELAVALGDQEAKTFHNLGVCYERIGSYGAAIAAFRQAIQIDPTWDESRRSLAGLFRRLGRNDEAIELCRGRLALDPTDARALIDLGDALLWRNELTPPAVMAEAQALYERAIARDPARARARVGLANALSYQGELEQAIACCRKAIEVEPQYANAHRKLGILLEDAGRREEAVACYRKCIELDAKNAFALVDLGNCLAKLGQVEASIPEFRKALLIDPQQPMAHFALGNKLAMLGRHEEGLKSAQRAAALDPGMPQAPLVIGMCLRAMGELDEAEAAFHRAIELAPELTDAHSELGLLRETQGDVQGALECYARVVELRPRSVEAHMQMGLLLCENERLEEAIPHFQGAIEVNPRFAPAHFNLGGCFLRLQRFEEAEVSLRRAEQLWSEKGDAFSREWLKRTRSTLAEIERMVVPESTLMEIARGEREGESASAFVSAARLASRRGQNAMAARTYARAFAAFPELSRTAPYLYHAACEAALAGCGQGEDAGTLDEEGRAALREQARRWLSQETDRLRQEIAAGAERAKAAREQMGFVRQSTELAGVRGESLDTLPEAEASAWRELWRQIEALAGG